MKSLPPIAAKRDWIVRRKTGNLNFSVEEVRGSVYVVVVSFSWRYAQVRLLVVLVVVGVGDLAGYLTKMRRCPRRQ